MGTRTPLSRGQRIERDPAALALRIPERPRPPARAWPVPAGARRAALGQVLGQGFKPEGFGRRAPCGGVSLAACGRARRPVPPPHAAA